MTDASRTVRSAVGIGAITALSRVVGFVRVLVVAAILGATYLGNAFQSANSVSNVVFELVAAGALSAVLVPAFVELFEAGDQRGAEEVAGGVLGVAVAGLGTIALVGMAASPLLARLLTIGVPDEIAAEQRALVTFLLLFFLPQIVLYAAGTVATGVLHARHRFLAVAAAPMANTIVMVAFLVAFRIATGPDPSLDLTLGQQLLLAAAGTGGVVAFCTVLVAACRRTGFDLRPRWRVRDARVVRALGQAGWGVVLHSSAGVLLGGAIVAGAAVEGGVIAYQVAWVFFLAPFAIFAQPIQTAILPEWAVEARDGDRARFGRSVRWALERASLPVLPVSVAMTVLALPAMRIVSVGRAAEGSGPDLLAAAVATLALGLVPYAFFLLLARAFYALGDSRTPGLVAIGVAVVGAASLAVGALLTEGTARIAALGLSHTIAHVVGAVVLAVLLARRIDQPVLSPVLGLMVAVNVAVGLVLWAMVQAGLDRVDGRAGDLVLCAAVATVGAALLALAYRVLGVRRRLTVRTEGPEDPAEPDAVPAGGYT
ncbi:MAG: hypothetical protein KDA97_13790 [Acidimicrobiales bacterium]|nr:hypothetical protein [Acidimicrobiales bacterium]